MPVCWPMIEARAAITDGFGKLWFDSVEVSPPGPDEVLVEIKAAGVCHTDCDFLNREEQRILGHEGAGIVLDIGQGVTHVQKRDRVLLNWSQKCGECFQCQRGNDSLCENRQRPPIDRTRYNGEGIDRMFFLGTMSTHTVVAKQAVSRIDVDIPFPAAAIVGCGVMTGYGSAVNTAKIEPGTSVAVIGAGGVGVPGRRPRARDAGRHARAVGLRPRPSRPVLLPARAAPVAELGLAQ